MHFVSCMQRQETTTLQETRDAERIPRSPWPMLFFAATLHKDNILILLVPLAGISSISSSCIHDMGPHQLNDPATVLLRLHLPYDLLKLLGVQTETDTMLHYFTCNCKHKQINSKHLTATSVVGFWQLRSEICSEDRTAWGKYAYAPVTRWWRQLPAQFIKFSFQITHPAALCAFGQSTTTSSILRTLDSNLKLHRSVPCVARSPSALAISILHQSGILPCKAGFHSGPKVTYALVEYAVCWNSSFWSARNNLTLVIISQGDQTRV